MISQDRARPITPSLITDHSYPPTSSLDNSDAPDDYSFPCEHPVLQTISETSISGRVDCSQLKSNGGTRRQQDGFQPTASDCRIWSGWWRALSRDRATYAEGC